MRRLRALRIQKLIGIVMLVVTALLMFTCDATAILFTLPMGLGMLFTKSVIIDI